MILPRVSLDCNGDRLLRIGHMTPLCTAQNSSGNVTYVFQRLTEHNNNKNNKIANGLLPDVVNKFYRGVQFPAKLNTD